VFKAIAEANRKQLLDKLPQNNGLTLNELCANHEMSLQTIIKHLVLLEAVNLVVIIKPECKTFMKPVVHLG
jgi:DNA-binding transcriptional ArsR family regulator